MRMKFSLRAKLTSAVAIIIVVLLTVAAAGQINNARLARLTMTVAENSLPSVDYIIEADRDMQQAAVAERSMLVAKAGTPQFDALRKFHEENIGQAAQRAGKFAKLADNPEEARMIKEYLSRHTVWAGATRRVVELAATGKAADRERARQLSFGDADKDFEAARTILNDLTDKELANARSLTEESERVSAVGRAIVLFAVVGLVVSALVAALFPRLVVNPIRALTARLNDIASGDGDLTARLDAQRHDELGDLARAFNNFVGKIQTLIRDVNAATSQLAAAAEELSAVTNDTHESTQRQHSETDQVAVAINEMTATVHEVARNAEQAATAAREADTQASGGRTVVAQTVDHINRLAGAVERVGEVIHRLDNDSKNIGKVLDVIRGIAEQTNLLALNAAIEAARAGDQGRGFAVVSDEVRTLAGRTQQSTREIQEMIEHLQTAATEAVAAMDNGRNEAKATVGQAAHTREILDAVTAAVTSISEMNQQIAAAAEEQSAVATEIDRNVTNISRAGEQTAESSRQTAAAGAELSRLAVQLQKQLSQFHV
jgi:methyl-accepting chemotaxis protein